VGWIFGANSTRDNSASPCAALGLDHPFVEIIAGVDTAPSRLGAAKCVPYLVITRGREFYPRLYG
jgi:hypothetical protein